MIQPDPIVEEVRKVRDAYAARFNYDLRLIFADLKRQEAVRGTKPAPSDPKCDPPIDSDGE